MLISAPLLRRDTTLTTSPALLAAISWSFYNNTIIHDTHTPYTTLFSLTRLDYISQRQIKEVRMPHNGRILGSPPQFNPILTCPLFLTSSIQDPLPIHSHTQYMYWLSVCLLAAGRDASVSHSQRLQRQHNTTQLTQDSHYIKDKWAASGEIQTDNTLPFQTMLYQLILSYCTVHVWQQLVRTKVTDRKCTCVNVHTRIHLWRSCRFISLLSAGGSTFSNLYCSCGMVTFVVTQTLSNGGLFWPYTFPERLWDCDLLSGITPSLPILQWSLLRNIVRQTPLGHGDFPFLGDLGQCTCTYTVCHILNEKQSYIMVTRSKLVCSTKTQS